MLTPAEAMLDWRLRQAAMDWLRHRCTDRDPFVHRDELMAFEFEGRRIPLVDRGRGIRKPTGFSAALSILTTYRRPGEPVPYEDVAGPDRMIRYKYQGTNRNQWDNAALGVAMRERLPLIWFFGVATSEFLPIFPIWIDREEPDLHQFVLALSEDELGRSAQTLGDPAERRYSQQITVTRLHQRVFRQKVIHAYGTACAMCRLELPSLLDAAHILPDRHPHGVPATSNGMALCKIHHAAYDQNILGVRPDLVIQTRDDILVKIDGPMLRYGLQEMHGRPLALPTHRADRPDPAAIEERYELFRATA